MTSSRMTERDALNLNLKTAAASELRDAREAIKVARDRAGLENSFQTYAYLGRRADACSRELSRRGLPQHDATPVVFDVERGWRVER